MRFGTDTVRISDLKRENTFVHTCTFKTFKFTQVCVKHDQYMDIEHDHYIYLFVWVHYFYNTDFIIIKKSDYIPHEKRSLS